MRVPLFDSSGKRTQEILEFDEKIFGDRVREVVLKEAILMYEARQRYGTHSTKTRKECSGSGRKLWRQKGTGRARVGPARAPHWKGGGVVFGPHPRNYSYSMPKKARHIAMNSAWLSKFQDKEVMIIAEFPQHTTPKTSIIWNTLETLGIVGRRILIGFREIDAIVQKSARNIPKVSLEDIVRFNPYILLANEKIVLLKNAFEYLITQRGGEVKILKREELY